MFKTNFCYNNPHPQGKIVKDCVKRAITLATGRDYRDISLELNRIKKITGCEKFNNPKNTKYYIENVLGGKKLSFPAEKGKQRMDGFNFTLQYPKGIYILRMAGHISCVIDGVINDTWDCSNKCVYNAWVIKKD